LSPVRYWLKVVVVAHLVAVAAVLVVAAVAMAEEAAVSLAVGKVSAPVLSLMVAAFLAVELAEAAAQMVLPDQAVAGQNSALEPMARAMLVCLPAVQFPA
jgi:hypothetical protein